MSLPHKVYATWRDIMENKSDPRTTNWFMMDSPLPTILMSLSYICAVKFIGPRLMANRKPFDAQKLQLYYNCFHLLINMYLFYEASVTGWMIGYSYRCESVNFSHTGIPMRMANCCWFYFISKFTDFFETFIFILLKRFDMVNLYHVAHHSIMPISVWWGVKFLAGGHSTFFGFINTAVHIVIYTYFVLITAWPQTRKYFFWWKAFYPFFQIGQFAMIFLHALQLLWNNDCNYPLAFVYFIGGHAALFYLLVTNKMRMDKQTKELRTESEAVYNKNEEAYASQPIGNIFANSGFLRHRTHAESST